MKEKIPTPNRGRLKLRSSRKLVAAAAVLVGCRGGVVEPNPKPEFLGEFERPEDARTTPVRSYSNPFPGTGRTQWWRKTMVDRSDGDRIMKQYWELHPPPAFLAEALPDQVLDACVSDLEAGRICSFDQAWPCVHMFAVPEGSVDVWIDPICVRSLFEAPHDH